jgi:ABC-type nitrate/sulfonate/bicarbonate transport system substrate-binding protein
MGTMSSSWDGRMLRRLSRRALLQQSSLGLGLAGLAAAGCGSGSQKQSPSASSGAGGSATPAGPPVSVKASYTGTPYDVPLFLATNRGLFQKQNLKVELTAIPGPQSIAALISGQVQFDHAGGTEAVAAGSNGGDLVIVAVQSAVFNFKFYVRPEIKAVSDLKGKKLGITSPGGSFDLALRLALPTFGLQPDKDVTLVSSGSIANVTTALLAGAIDGAAIVVGPDSQKIESSGPKALFDFADLKLTAPGTVIAVQRSYLTSHRDLVQHYVDAIVQATAQYKRDRATSLEELGKIYQTNEQSGLNVAYDYYTRDVVMPRLPLPKAEQFQTSIDVLCKKDTKACGFDVSKMLDTSFVQSAADRGLDK